MNKLLFIVVQAILLIGMVSASLSDSRLEITLDKDYSEAIFHLESIESEYDGVNAEFQCTNGELSVNEGLPNFIYDLLDSSSADFCEAVAWLGENGTFSFSNTELLNGINFQVNFIEGMTYPQFSEVSINGDVELNVDFDDVSVSSTLDSLLREYSDYNSVLELTPTELNELIVEYSTNEYEMEGNAQLTKNGYDYTITYDKGFGDDSEEYETEIEELVELYTKNTFEKLYDEQTLTFNPANLIADVPPEITDYLGDYEAPDENYDVSVDLSELKRENGEYEIPITIYFGEELTPITKIVYLTISGMPITSYEVDDTTDEITFDSSFSELKEIIIPSTVSSTKVITLDMSSIKTIAGAVILVNDFKLERIISGLYSYSADIPAGTIISGGLTWNGIMTLPTVQLNSDFKAPSGKVDVVVELGSNDVELTFSNPIKITIEGMTDKKAAWARGTGDLTQIETECNSATDASNIDPTTTRECYFDDGNDLIIWTYHFTSFSAYTPSSSSSSHGGNSGTVYSKAPTSKPSEEIEIPTAITPKEPEQRTFFQRILDFLGLTGRVADDGTITEPNLTPVAVIFTFLIVLIAVILFVVKKRK